MSIGWMLQSPRAAYDTTIERWNILEILHASGMVEAATVFQQMSSQHVRYLHAVLEPGNLGVGLEHGQLLEDYLKFWRCWEKTEVFGVEQALGMNRSSCFSVVDLEEEGDIDIRIKVTREEGERWILNRHPPLTLK